MWTLQQATRTIAYLIHTVVLKNDIDLLSWKSNLYQGLNFQYKRKQYCTEL